MMKHTCTASFACVSLVNAILDPLDDDNEVINDPVIIESIVTADSLDMTWCNEHSAGDSRHALISFLHHYV
jgi:hypothetical protein